MVSFAMSFSSLVHMHTKYLATKQDVGIVEKHKQGNKVGMIA